MRIFLTNLGKYNEGELVGLWFKLPYTKEELEDALKAIGIDGQRYEEYFITDDDNDLGLYIGEYENLSELNEVAERISALNENELIKLRAVIECKSSNIFNMINIIGNLDEYTLYTEIKTDYELGHFYIHEVGGYDLNHLGELTEYLDYEAYGHDIRINANGGFTSFGWLERA